MSGKEGVLVPTLFHEPSTTGATSNRLTMAGWCQQRLPGKENSGDFSGPLAAGDLHGNFFDNASFFSHYWTPNCTLTEVL